MTAPLEIDGCCDPRFTPVREAFARNFVDHDELGAACCVIMDGEMVVDLWGGHQDAVRTRPWQRDTLVGFYSVGKAMTATCALHLIDTTDVALDDEVARYWPEFAQAGKADITLRQLLTHRAALPAIRKRMPEGSMLDWCAMTEALAAQAPWWEPGTAHGYHTNTFGFLVGEVVRRVSGLSVGAYLRRYITEPLGADLAIGLRDQELTRVAELDWPAVAASRELLNLDRDLPEHERMLAHAYGNPSGLSSIGVMNTTAWRKAEVPSTNGQGTARGIARVFAALAGDGSLEGVRIVQPATLREAISPQAEGVDLVLGRYMRWGLGYQLTHESRPMGPHPLAFGHFGNGGSLGFADPTTGIAFGYVMNRIVRNWKSPQNRALLDALYRCV